MKMDAYRKLCSVLSCLLEETPLQFGPTVFVSDQTYDSMMMEGVPKGTSQHANACGCHTPEKMSVAGQKDDFHGGCACLDQATQAVLVMGRAADFLDWRGGQGLTRDAGSTQTATAGHTWKLMWRWSFIRDKYNTRKYTFKWRILLITACLHLLCGWTPLTVGCVGRSLNEHMVTNLTNWILRRSFIS